MDAISPEDSQRITTLIMAGLNARRGEPDFPRVDSLYEPERGRLRVMLTANPALTCDLIRTIAALAERPARVIRNGGRTMAEIYKSEEGRRLVQGQYRRILERWPVPCEHRVVSTREGDTFVVVSGDPSAPSLVLFHGSGTNSASWMRDVATWARDYRVYAVDMIGEPGLSAPSRPLLASSAYADWLDDVWNGLGLAHASVVGISLGGWLGLDFAMRRTPRQVALADLSGRHRTPEPDAVAEDRLVAALWHARSVAIAELVAEQTTALATADGRCVAGGLPELQAATGANPSHNGCGSRVLVDAPAPDHRQR